MSSGHSASWFEYSDGQWQAGCAQCGWFSKRRYANAARAERSAHRHVTEGEAMDRRIHQRLYGPRK